jgi:hypothetical protein
MTLFHDEAPTVPSLLAPETKALQRHAARSIPVYTAPLELGVSEFQRHMSCIKSFVGKYRCPEVTPGAISAAA